MFVPQYRQASTVQIEKLKAWMDSHLGSILVLTGAGVSTESGIPDYRSEGVGLYARSNYRPIMYNDFLKNAKARQRYWARNYFGWPKFGFTQPNDVHLALTKLEELQNNKNLPLITQNVDGLHKKAGTLNVVEMHGTAHKIHCIKCPFEMNRNEFQTWLKELNPGTKLDEILASAPSLRPDGDIEFVTQEIIENFHYPSCSQCEGLLKPKIIFFGDTIPKENVHIINEAIKECNGLLVLGSSISVWSAYRIVLDVSKRQKSIAIVNIGPIRIDKKDPINNIDILINSNCGSVLPGIVDNLSFNYS